MSDPRPKELIHAEELYFNGKVEESLEIIRNYERKLGITPEEQLWALLLRGHVYGAKQQHKKAVEMGERTYTMSKELGLVSEAIEALLLKVQCALIGKIDEAFNYVLETEKLLSTFSDSHPYNYSKIVELNLLLKSWVYDLKGDYKTAINLAEEGLVLVEKTERKLFIGFYFQVICNIYMSKGEQEKAREYAMKSIEVMRNINFEVGIAHGLQAIGQSYFLEGNMNKALKLIQESLSVEKIFEGVKARSLYVLGDIYRTKGLLDIALENYKQVLKLATEFSISIFIGASITGIGSIYRQKGELNEAKQYFEQAITHFEESGYQLGVSLPALYLLQMTLGGNSQEQADYYLSKLQKFADQSKSQYIQQAYQLGRSFMLRATSRMRDNVKAEGILKQLIEEDISNPEFHILALISLCDLYLEELSMYNNPEIFQEINPLIAQLLKIAEEVHSFSLLSETYLLQGRLALIKLNLDYARQNLTKAQRIADEHDLTLLARKISHEHDKLVEEFETWQNYKKTQVTMSKRIKLASIDGVIDRMQEKRAINPPELVDEQATLLLIIAEGGVLVFSYPFTDEWEQDETLFSSFLSAFTSFSDEFFSEGLDRAKFGKHTVLMESVGSFSVCYLYKGQTYAAKQKLSKFTEAIQNNTSIWPILEKFYKTSQILEIKDSPFLEHLITNIFVR